MHYLRGKADWMVRALPCEPPVSVAERLGALRYFINNIAPGLRSAWITASGRSAVMERTKDDVPRIAPTDQVVAAPARGQLVSAVLNPDGVLLGVVESDAKAGRAIDRMNPAPQTIRPDMTQRLAASLLERHPYIVVTTSLGKYLGRYVPPHNHDA